MLGAQAKTPKLPQGFSIAEAQTHFAFQLAFRTRTPLDSALEQGQMIRWRKIPETDVAWSWWQDREGRIWLCFPGSAPSSGSWLMNIYAGMIPAKGSIMVEGRAFAYQLSTQPDARIHAGWSAGLFQFLLSESEFMDSLYQAGRRTWVVSGHSQGGAIAFLMAAYLHQLQDQGHQFQELEWKVYTSGAPKPGNFWFSRDALAHIPQDRLFAMAINADWVPLMPVGLQQLTSFPQNSPVYQWKTLARQMPKWKQRLGLRYVVRNMTKPLNRTSRRYYHWLAETPQRKLMEKWNGLTLPDPIADFDYHSFGTQVVLMPDDAFFSQFPMKDNNWFAYHSLKAYSWFFKPAIHHPAPLTTQPLDGTWQLMRTPEWHTTRLREHPIYLTFDWVGNKLVMKDSCGLGFLPFQPEGAGFIVSQPFQITTGSSCQDQLLTQISYLLNGSIMVHLPDQTSMEWQVSGAEPWIWWRIQAEE